MRIQASTLLLCLLPEMVLAQLPLPTLNRDGLPGLSRSISPRSLGDGVVVFGGAYSFAPGSAFALAGKGDPETVATPGLSAAYPSLAMGWGAYLDLGLALPLYWGEAQAPIGMDPFGDLRLRMKWQVPYGHQNNFLDLAVWSGVDLPTSRPGHGLRPRELAYYPATTAEENGESHAHGLTALSFPMGAALGFDWRHAFPALPVFTDINLGMRLSPVPDPYDAIYAWSLGFRFPIGTRAWFQAAWENEFTRVFNDSLNPRRSTLGLGTTVEALPGLLQFEAGIEVETASGGAMSLTWQSEDGRQRKTFEVVAQPRWSAHAGVRFWIGALGDPDRDGIRGRADACPLDPEDRDMFQDEDGCPDNDNDMDGVTDRADGCPAIPEDRDGFQDDDGCPDSDDDRDGVADSMDVCPFLAEDADNYEDGDGCPEAGPVPETLAVLPRPVTVDTPPKPEAPAPRSWNFKSFHFATGSSALEPGAMSDLDSLVAMAKADTGIRIRISGHTDNSGPIRTNQLLSERRAAAVRIYLLEKGVDSQRIRAGGNNYSLPVQLNSNEAGRSENRRVDVTVERE